MRWGIYIRVSSTDQNTSAQERELQRWLDGNGVAADSTEWFIDRASGKDLHRPEFERLQKAIFNGEIRSVAIWRLDRLSRSLRDGINVLHDWCERNVRVVSVSQMIDLDGTIGKLIASVLFAVAEMELSGIRERQRSGIEAAKLRGVYQGRQSGTTKGKPGRAVELRKKGLNDSEISEAMGVSRRTVQRYLRRSDR